MFFCLKRFFFLILISQGYQYHVIVMVIVVINNQIDFICDTLKQFSFCHTVYDKDKQHILRNERLEPADLFLHNCHL